MFHKNIRLPGVYIFNSNNSTLRGLQGAPIYSTMSSMGINGMNDTSETVLVFPKYKVIFYEDGGFSGTATTHDNTNGTKCIYVTSSNKGSSCRVYYDNVEIADVFSTTGT